uniref:Histone deacetylase complex subunit SAP130 C-terminal domain-containing protein n=1 Tax=Glossina brevipalpis TaxID=37001 RepID=A0A1A9X115_9MUSC
MSSADGNNATGGGGTSGPPGNVGGSNITTATGESLKIIKTQLIPHPHPVTLQQHQHSPIPSPTTTTPTPAPTPPICTTPNSSQLAPSPIQIKNTTNVTNLFTLNPVAAKITHIKTTTIDAVAAAAASNVASGISLSNLAPAVASGAGTLVTSGGVTTMSAIKVGAGGASGAPIALNTSQAANAAAATSIRAIGTGGQSTQVRVVMGNLMPSMIKQLESAGPGRAQITAFPTAPARSVSNTSITVTRPATQAAYLPRANVTATPMAGVGVGVGVPTGQRLVTPIRTTPTSVTATGIAGATVTGITAAGNFVRGTTVSRNSTSPATTVISPATSTTWMAANPAGQVQLIRAIPHQSRQRSGGSVVAVTGTVVTTTGSTMQSATTVVSGQQQTATSKGQPCEYYEQEDATIQAVSSASHSQQQQQTYVATILPPRPHQATLVYSPNVATSQPLAQTQFNPTSVATTGPRFAVATPLTATAGAGTAPRQIRPIPLGKSFSAAKLNTTNISIRTPNLPQLTPTITSSVSNVSTVSSSVASNPPRNTTVSGVSGSTSNVMSSTNLPATRIIQLQQQPGGTAQLCSTGRLAANVVLQPIIVNTSGGGKFGIRPPVTMATKVQPSLTITQLGIGKLPSSGSTSTIAGGNSLGSQSNVCSTGNSASASVSTTSITATNISANTATQLVNVSQGGSAQLLTTQNIVSSATGTSSGGGATVVPLAIGTRGTSGGNIITGTMTPIKNAGSITVGKVMTQAQLTSPLENSATVSGTAGPSGNVYIHHAPVPQRPLSASSSGSSGGISTSNTSISMSSNTSAANVLTSTGTVTSGTFLQPGSTIYYESVPANSVQVSTGVLSLTTTTVTNSTISQNQIVSSTANLSISSLPFVTHTGGNTSTATFTVVPSGGGRTIGQVQIPVCNAAAHLQALPVRFSQLPASNLAAAAADAIAVSQTTPQVIQQSSGCSGETSLIIPTAQQTNVSSGTNVVAMNSNQQTQHMLIPLQTSIKMTAGNGSTGTAVVSNFLRKRDIDGSPILAAKNLGPTLISMGSSSGMMSANSSSNPSINNSYSLTSVNTSNTPVVLCTETLNKKDKPANSVTLCNVASSTSGMLVTNRNSRTESPASSDGSTTVSANSSPGVDQQMQDGNMVINRMISGPNVETHFNPINELYPNHHAVAQQHTTSGTPVTSRNLTSVVDHHNIKHAVLNSNIQQQRLNGGPIECPPRKKSRKSTNDSSQPSPQNPAALSLPQLLSNNPSVSTTTNNNNNAIIEPTASLAGTIPSAIVGNCTPSTVVISHEVTNGKENTKPVEYVLKRPRNLTLLSQNWKSAHNHFQRYSDVKPREERKPTIMDLAKQSNVLGKINGWKIYHLRSQMEDLCENEALGYDKLSTMLKQMESHGISNEIERISDLVKGNMQRSKIIVDGVNEAQNQIMKIFDHKSHISDIINRCASKRNFKKREKP